MTLPPRTVTVKQLPEKFDRNRERLFFRELENAMNVERPAIVLDCSHVCAIDVNALHLLLCCLEEAMKRNGDVRLAGVSGEAWENLQHASVDRLFRIFETTDKAIESFQRRTATPSVYVPSNPNVASERAA
ncbi:MAG TPA: STAS domain-containing protein [Terracidiphilus sp.]|jgi:anti-anti-sigma regulatory factor|nr:STAS domain-containing protein [Terracidiphilus sp.]